MHDDRIISTLHRLWFILIAFTAISCNEDVVGMLSGSNSSGNDSQPTSEVTVEFNILDPDAKPDTKVDTESNWGEYNNTASEKVIKSIHLFAVDYDTETGVETVEEVVKADLVPGDFTSNGVRTGHTFTLRSGTKRFYVGANMREDHIEAFCSKNALQADSYESSLSMVMNGYESKTGEGTDILMFSGPAIDLSTGEGKIDINKNRFISISAELKRLVSKVMVVADYDGSYSATTLLIEMNRTESIPYIETDKGYFFDFQFILYNANKTFNIQETKNTEQSSLFNIDPNWNIADWVTLDPANGKIRMKTMADSEGNFSFWGTEDIAVRLESTSEWWCSSVPSSSSDYLGQGLYCLENTVFDDPKDALVLDGENKVNAAFLTTTHVFLKMRFAPKTVYGGSDNSTVTDPRRLYHMFCNTEKDTDGLHPYTFYINKTNGFFYTFTGANRWINLPKADGTYYYKDETKKTRWTWDDFETYLGGWVYYRTFFEEGGQDNQDNKISFDGINAWGIRRNDYCILTINNVVSWGDPQPGNAYIKVKSQTLTEWVNKGYNSIDITPKK